jgi:hypothetical protein
MQPLPARMAGPGTTPTGPVERDRHREEEGGIRSVGAAPASMTPGPVLPAPGRTPTIGTE